MLHNTITYYLLILSCHFLNYLFTYSVGIGTFRHFFKRQCLFCHQDGSSKRLGRKEAKGLV